MKFSDAAWDLYKNHFGVTDDQRAGLEQHMADEQAFFLAQAGGDHEIAIGLMTIFTATSMARDLGESIDKILQLLVKHAGSPAARKNMWAALNKATLYLAEKKRPPQ